MNTNKDKDGISPLFFRKVGILLYHLNIGVLDIDNRKQVAHRLAQFLRFTTEFGPSVTERLMSGANTVDKGDTV